MKITMKPTWASIIFMLALVLALIIAGPLLLIWALNTLFNLNIDYTVWTWLAALIIGATVGPKIQKKD